MTLSWPDGHSLGLLPSEACFVWCLSPPQKSPSSKNTYKTTCKLLKKEISMTTAYHHTGVFSIKNPTIESEVSWSSLLSFYTLEEQSFQQMVPWTRIEFQLPHLKNFKLKQRSASFGIQRNFKLNKDSQTEIFSLVSAVSNPKEPKTSTNFCILCAVREELTYICRFCLTKVYPLKFFILEMKVSSVLVGREVYPLLQAGKVSITC